MQWLANITLKNFYQMVFSQVSEVSKGQVKGPAKTRPVSVEDLFY